MRGIPGLARPGVADGIQCKPFAEPYPLLKLAQSDIDRSTEILITRIPVIEIKRPGTLTVTALLNYRHNPAVYTHTHLRLVLLRAVVLCLK